MLRHARRADRVSLGLQPAGRVDWKGSIPLDHAVGDALPGALSTAGLVAALVLAAGAVLVVALRPRS